MYKSVSSIITILLIISTTTLAGCQPNATPTDLKITTPAIHPSSVPKSTATRAPTLTLTPTQTKTPSPTPPRPTPTLSSSLSSLRVVFLYEKQLWIWQNSSAISLTDVDTCSRIKISSDGKMIAFGQGELWVMNSDGTNKRLLVSADNFKSMEPKEPGVSLNQFEWIPNTHNLLFNTILLIKHGLSLTDDLYLVNADTGQRSNLRKPGEGGVFFISPDGQRIVTVTPNQINIMDIDGGNFRLLLEYPHILIPSEFSYYAHPVWVENSQLLMVAIPPQNIYYGDTSPMTVWQLPTDGASPKIVAQLPVDPHAAISPDGSKIAYDHLSKPKEIHISNIDGSEDSIYGDGSINFHIWAPNSEHFVLISDRYLLGKIGSEPIPLTGPISVYGSFSWVDEIHFLFFGQENNEPFGLRLGTIGEPSILLSPWTKVDDCLGYGLGYDFVK